MRGLWHGGLLVLILFLLLVTPPSALTEDRFHSDPSSPHSSVFTRFTQFVPLTASYGPSSGTSQPLNDLFTRGNDPSALTVQTQRPLIDGHLQTESTLAYASPDGRSVDQSRDGRHQAVRLGLTGTEGGLRYGVRYRLGGESAPVDRDQESREIFMGWQARHANLKGSVEQRTTNANQEPSRPRLNTLEKRLALDLAAPHWPTLSLAYSQADTNSGMIPMGLTPQRQQVDTIETGLTYHLSGITLRAASRYAVAEELLRAPGTTMRLTHVVSSSYSPIAPLTLTSSLTFTDERERGSGQHTETPAAEMTVAYHLPADYSVRLLSGYSRTQDSLGSVDFSTFNAKSQVSWHAERFGLSSAMLSLETAYSATADLSRATRSPDNVSAIFQVTLTGRSWADMIGPATRWLPFSDRQ